MPYTDPQTIIADLQQPHARISPKYFYDQRGSELFEAITRLPEYYLTRTEQQVLQEHGAAIARSVGTGALLVEPGAGSCTKARKLCRLIQPRGFVAVDISADFLHASVADMQAEFPALPMRAIAADLSRDFALPPDIERRHRLIFYPGSSIGNFDRPHAATMLARLRALVDDDGGLLIGFDLPKPVEVLEAAYNDSAGVTAAFNCNVLAHLNRLIGSDFEPTQWQHHAFFNAQESRIEMHLLARQALTVHWPGGTRRFAPGERIHTENSYKYPLDEFVAMLGVAGFSKTTCWTDAQRWFALVHAQV